MAQEANGHLHCGHGSHQEVRLITLEIKPEVFQAELSPADQISTIAQASANLLLAVAMIDDDPEVTLFIFLCFDNSDIIRIFRNYNS